MHTAGALAGSEKSGNGGSPGVGVHLDAAHDVVAGGPYFHRLFGDVDAGQLFELVVHRRQPLLDLLGSQPRGDVEVDPAVRAAPAGLDFGVDRAGDLIAGQQVGGATGRVVVLEPLVGFLLALGVLAFEHRRDVVEHEPLAVGVLEHPAVTAHTLGDEDSFHARRPHHAGRVELDELHVDQRRAGPQRQRVAVAGVLPGVRGDLERLADPAGGHDHRGRLEQDEVAAFPVIAERTRDRVAVFDQLGDRALGEDLDPGLVVTELGVVFLLQRDDLLLHRADQLQAGAVADVRQPGVGVSTEVALADLAVFEAVEQRAVGLQLPNPVGCLFGVQLGHPPVVQELPTAHRVAEVGLPVVLRVGVTHRRRAAALGHDRVGLTEQRLGHHRDLETAFARLDDRAQTCAAGTNHDDVVGVPFDLSH